MIQRILVKRAVSAVGATTMGSSETTKRRQNVRQTAGRRAPSPTPSPTVPWGMISTTFATGAESLDKKRAFGIQLRSTNTWETQPEVFVKYDKTQHPDADAATRSLPVCQRARRWPRRQDCARLRPPDRIHRRRALNSTLIH